MQMMLLCWPSQTRGWIEQWAAFVCRRRTLRADACKSVVSEKDELSQCDIGLNGEDFEAEESERI